MTYHLIEEKFRKPRGALPPNPRALEWRYFAQSWETISWSEQIERLPFPKFGLAATSSPIG
jgi:hypothetical protein